MKRGVTQTTDSKVKSRQLRAVLLQIIQHALRIGGGISIAVGAGDDKQNRVACCFVGIEIRHVDQGGRKAFFLEGFDQKVSAVFCVAGFCAEQHGDRRCRHRTFTFRETSSCVIRRFVNFLVPGVFG